MRCSISVAMLLVFIAVLQCECYCLLQCRAEALTHDKFNSNSCDPHCIHILRVISELRTTVAQSSAAHTRRDNSSKAEHNAAVQQQQQQLQQQQWRLNIVPILITSNGRLLRHQLNNSASTLYVKVSQLVLL
jgi:hypothetical protein